jgi:hypothetical protein
MSSSNTLAMVPIFNSSDYRQWAQKMEDYLKSLKLWRYVTGTNNRLTPVLPAAPTPAEQQAMNNWDDLNDQAQGIIAVTILLFHLYLHIDYFIFLFLRTRGYTRSLFSLSLLCLSLTQPFT